MHYTLTFVTPELVYIQWYPDPTSRTKPQSEYIAELRAIVHESPHPLYFISDLRLSRISDVGILQKLGTLSKHPNFAGGVAFSKDTISELFVGVFERFAAPEKADGMFFDTLEQALAALDAIKPGVASGVDWKAFVAQRDGMAGTANGA